MQHLPMDTEARAHRFLAAMNGLSTLLKGASPGLPLDSEHMQGIIALLADEAHAVVALPIDHPPRAND